MPRSGRRGGYEAQRRSPAEGDPVKRCFSSVIGDIMGMMNERGVAGTAGTAARAFCKGCNSISGQITIYAGLGLVSTDTYSYTSLGPSKLSNYSTHLHAHSRAWS